MSFRRTFSTIAVAAATMGGLALGGSVAATAAQGKTPTPTDHPGGPCGGVRVQTLTTALSGDPAAMTLEVTLNHDVGRLVAVVGGPDGVLEYGPLAPVSGSPGSPGSYKGVFLPPSGAPVAAGDKVLVTACGDHWLTTATVGTDWTASPGGPGKGPSKPDGPPEKPTPPPAQSSSGCIGAQIVSVASALTSDSTGVTVTITVNHSLGRDFSAYVQSGGEMVAGGSISEEAGQAGTYQGTLTSKSGAAIAPDAQVVFGSCGGTPNRIGGTTTIGSSTWSPLK